jgi:hypothetical protein
LAEAGEMIGAPDRAATERLRAELVEVHKPAHRHVDTLQKRQMRIRDQQIGISD